MEEWKNEIKFVAYFNKIVMNYFLLLIMIVMSMNLIITYLPRLIERQKIVRNFNYLINIINI